MGWFEVAAIWLLLMILTIAFFHAMVTVRDMEEIKFDEDGDDNA